LLPFWLVVLAWRQPSGVLRTKNSAKLCAKAWARLDTKQVLSHKKTTLSGGILMMPPAALLGISCLNSNATRLMSFLSACGVFDIINV